MIERKNILVVALFVSVLACGEEPHEISSSVDYGCFRIEGEGVDPNCTDCYVIAPDGILVGKSTTLTEITWAQLNPRAGKAQEHELCNLTDSAVNPGSVLFEIPWDDVGQLRSVLVRDRQQIRELDYRELDPD